MMKNELIAALLEQANLAVSLDGVSGPGALSARKAACEAANDIMQQLVDEHEMDEEEIGDLLQGII